MSQDVIIRESDCGATQGIWVYEISDGKQVSNRLPTGWAGRYPVNDIIDPTTGEVLVPNSKLMNDQDAKKIVASGLERVEVRSVLNCRARHGVCAKCYGSNLANEEPIGIGEAVGIIAAQSIGEPGTQLTIAYLPHRRRGRQRYHAGLAPSRGIV